MGIQEGCKEVAHLSWVLKNKEDSLSREDASGIPGRTKSTSKDIEEEKWRL